MLRNVRDLYGSRVRGTDGDLGKVHDVLFDDVDWQVRYVVLDAGGLLSSRRVPIAPGELRGSDWQGDTLSASLTVDQVRNSPVPEDGKWPPSPDQEARLRRHYGWPDWAAGNPLQATTTITPPQAERVTKDEVPAAIRSETGAWAEDRPQAILRSARSLIGFHVEANDGGAGSVDDLLLDQATWAVRYLVVEMGGLLPGKKVLVSPHWILPADWDGKMVHLDLSRESIRSSPEYDGQGPVAREYETELYDHYGRPKYWEE